MCLLKSQILLFFSGVDPDQRLLQEDVTIRYPKISSSETIDCDCGNVACDLVLWFRSHISGKVEFLAKCNNADRVTYGDDIDKNRFKLSKRASNSFMLRIINVTEDDKGIYSCILKEKNLQEIWKPGTLLLPGGLYAKCFVSQLNIVLNVKFSKISVRFQETGEGDG